LIYGVLVALYVTVIAFIVRQWRSLRAEMAASERWTPAASRVVESSLREVTSTRTGTTYFPHVVYDYAVDGRAFRGQRIAFGHPAGFSFKRNAERRLQALVDAASVRVFHDPADPSRAVIERSAPILRTNLVLRDPGRRAPRIARVPVLVGERPDDLSYASNTATRSKHQ
jgi:hypothetical protein